MKLRYKEITLLLAIFLLFLPLFFERIYDDEAIYWSLSKSINARGLGEIYKISRMPLAILINSPFMVLNDGIFVPRLVSALFAISSALLIFEIAKIYYDERAAFISSLLFIFSFQTIRFGTRFYLDIYGVFFFLLSVYLIKKDRTSLAGFSFALSMLSRETWFGLYPFIILYVWKDRKSIYQFIIGSLIPLLVFFVPVCLTTGLSGYFGSSGFSQVSYLPATLYKIPVYIMQGWAEFLVVQLLTVIGFVSWILKKRESLLLLILPQFPIISVIQGFISNGALTQYPLGLQASMVLVAGPGLLIIWKKYFKKYNLQTFFISILLAQLILFSYLATALSLRGAIGVHDFGYWNDEEVITLLKEKAKNETIAGLHGAFINDAKEWIWWERGVGAVLEREPDWYVIVEPQLIKFKKSTEDVKEVEVYRVGPYIILHSHPPGHLHEVIEPNREFNKWAFRG